MDSVFTPVSHVGEFGLIDRLKAVLAGGQTNPDLLAGIGDDAAVYRIDEHTAHVITTDALIEGVHFDRSFMPWTHLGHKAIAVNVSDVAAMNAVARYAVVSIGLPRNVSVEMVEALYAGMRDACERYGLQLVGGDTTAAPQLVLSVTVVGEADISRVAYRRGARPGDLVCVTGDVGGAYAGLQVLLEQRRSIREMGESYTPDLEPYRYVIKRQLTPEPRTDVIADWAKRGVKPKALIDISDGVASEVHHLCRASGCGARIRGAALPIDPETRFVADEQMQDVDTFALFGGEDYELLFALDPADEALLDPTTFNVIGVFTDVAEGITLITPEGPIVPLHASGFVHFGGAESDGLDEPEPDELDELESGDSEGPEAWGPGDQ